MQCGLLLTLTSHSACKTVSQQRSARKRAVFNERDLGRQVFLEGTFSKRKHLRTSEKMPNFSAKFLFPSLMSI